MKQLTPNIYYTNFNGPASTIPSKQVSTIVIGDSGMGKSKLVNNLCGSNHRVGIDRKGITQQISSQTCRYNTQFRIKFQISDSPGIQSKRDQILKMIRHEVKWNTVFILSKLTARYGDETLTNLKNIGKMLRKQDIQIVFLVSHLDILDGDTNRQSVLKSFYDTLLQYEFQQKLILFSNINSEFDQLSILMYEICLNNERARRPRQSKIKNEVKQTYIVRRERKESFEKQMSGCPCQIM